MPDATLSGADFKKQLREGKPKMGLFLNAHSTTVAEQLGTAGTTGCWSIHSTARWATKNFLRCSPESRMAARSPWSA